MDKTLLTVEDVAVLLNMHPSSVRRFVAKGELPIVRIGSSVRFETEAVRQFVEACRVVSKGA
jgi:excisionase family DNA binding protein